MLDHVTLTVSDLPRARAFYDLLLAPLELSAIHAEGDSVVGYRRDGQAFFWIAAGTPGPTHVALTAPTRQAVENFHAAGLAAGGGDNGAPGLRRHYGAGYFAAFVQDPDGHNIEAVLRERGPQ